MSGYLNTAWAGRVGNVGIVGRTTTRRERSRIVRFLAPPPGASIETLKRRVSYGGRKGRSAARRLRL